MSNALSRLLFETPFGPRHVTLAELFGRKAAKKGIQELVTDQDDKKAEFNPVLGKLAFYHHLAKLASIEKEAPFKSEAQRRKFYAMQSRGEISKDEVQKWESETPDKKLPERLHKKEAKSLGLSAGKYMVDKALGKATDMADASRFPVSAFGPDAALLVYPKGRPQEAYSPKALEKLRDLVSHLAQIEGDVALDMKALNEKYTPGVQFAIHRGVKPKILHRLKEFLGKAAEEKESCADNNPTGPEIRKSAFGVVDAAEMGLWMKKPALGFMMSAGRVAVRGAKQTPPSAKMASEADRLIGLLVKDAEASTGKGWLGRSTTGAPKQVTGKNPAQEMAGSSTEEQVPAAGRGPHVQRGA